MFFIDCSKCEKFYGGSPKAAGELGWIVGKWNENSYCPDCKHLEPDVDRLDRLNVLPQYPNLSQYPGLASAVDIYAEEEPPPSVSAVLLSEAQRRALSISKEKDVVGFDRPENGSMDRYRERRAVRPWASHTLWWVVHNVIAHPLIGILPFRPLFRFHDWTSERMHGV